MLSPTLCHCMASLTRSTYAIVLGCYLTLIVSVWLPAVMSFSRSGWRSRRRVVPLTRYETPRPSYARRPTLLRQLGASAAGRAPRVSDPQPFASAERATAAPSRLRETASLTSILSAATRFVFSPPPTLDEIMSTLRMRAAVVRRSDRALRIYGAVLFSTAHGRVLLFDALRLDLSAELLGFLVDAGELRSTAEAWLAEVVLDESIAEETTPMQDVKSRLLTSFGVNLNLLVVRYLEFGAPHFVSVGINAVRVLLEASRGLAALAQRSTGGGAASNDALGFVEAALVAMYNAEVEVFEQMVSEPLEWGVSARPELFDDWAAQTVTALQAQTLAAALPDPAVV